MPLHSSKYNDFFLNIIDKGSGASFFAKGLGRSGAEAEIYHLESGMIYALSDFLKEIGRRKGGEETIELVRRKKTLSNEENIFIDARIAYGEESILVSHISTGSNPVELKTDRSKISAEELLFELDKRPNRPLSEFDSFNNLLNSLKNYDVVGVRVDAISTEGENVFSYDSIQTDDELRFFESGLAHMLFNYSNTVAENDDEIETDVPFMIKRKFEGPETLFVESRLYPSEKFILMTHTTRKRENYHVTDFILSKLNETILGSFEARYSPLSEWGGRIDEFEDFGEKIESLKEAVEGKFMEAYQRSILFGLEDYLSSGIIDKLRRDSIKPNKSIFFDAIGGLLTQPGIGKKVENAIKRQNEKYRPLSFIFNFDLYQP